jgi:malto-oligosyltrehalose trehalohydrolase
VLDGGPPLPDPASRFQPAGVQGASRVIAPHAFAWTDQEWRGVPKHRLLLYELHVGAFTRAGTLRAATERLSKLVELGVTAVELMPVVQTPGRWNWGYDGVDLFAVRNTYGEPDDLKLFVDACHARGLAVILDVVYNHVGPEGAVLGEFGPYLSQKYETPWGVAFNFDGEGCESVRAFILDNALELLRENHLDGLRVDSVHHMHDESSPGILEELRRTVDEFAATVRRPIHLVYETNVFDPALLQPREGTPCCDAIWCDDLMHSLLTVARPKLQLTTRNYQGASDLAQVLRQGYVYAYDGREAVRVKDPPPLEVSEDQDSLVASFVSSLQNHDGVGNHPGGKRVHQLASTAFQKAAAALNLLSPGLPLLFMGEEWALDAPFPFFCDHEDPRVRDRVERNRARETAGLDPQGALPPLDEDTFHKAQWDETMSGDEEMFSWYQKLIILRKEGLREGWLAMERLRVDHEPTSGVFLLHFTRQYGAAIELRVRLTPVSAKEAPPVAVSFTGHVLLSSRPKWELAGGRLSLHANHAVVSLEAGQGTS